MKITVRDTPKGMEVYVAKKDLEELIVDSEHPGIWGGWAKLTNGWVFDMPAYDTPPALPITIEARRLSTE
ncbi:MULTISPECIES: putative nitrogen fixation protein NifT [Rhodovulum]|uniref:Nitrogen fixation protein NifT n=2 Tax=Rhodovulum TaxID=34008 RepID=A0A8E2VNK6_9RHOB|nr:MULTISPECIES: putative nitrogen fixation protein NifT [Rhodovulum]PTW51958.1 nitrogen fixation protein NifT [Rhodovulum kholense]RAP40173.1 putative nitrogen fixation protein NifT [Rhodovulum viride]